MAHRGPDDSGLEIIADQGVALGMRRLSVVDIAGGHQPMWNATGACCVVFNGEIYNADDLRRELEQLGRPFRTDHSDTEVIVEGWMQWGTDLFRRLNGMFATAIWDCGSAELVVARDRMGEKPLYVAKSGGGYAIGSELKAVLQDELTGRRLDLVALDQFLSFDYILGPRTPFQDVTKLPAGTFMRFTGTEQILERYWQPNFHTAGLSDAQLRSRLDQLLDEAVRRRMVADVPLGLFLSGGIDSTTVGYYMRRHSEEVHSFSIGFEERGFDETHFSSIAATALGTKHHVEMFSPRKIRDLVPTIPDVLDEPMGDQSIFPTLLLSLFTRRHVTVALGGDGSDELWLGYNSYKPLKVAWTVERVPFLAPTIGSVARRMPRRMKESHIRGMQFAQRVDRGAAERQLGLLGAFSGDARWVLSPEVRAALPGNAARESAQHLLDGCPRSGAAAAVAAYLRGYLQEDILVKVDRASMAASLEVRAPFLDNDLVDLALASSPRQRMRGFVGKKPIRDLMTGRIPQVLLDRPKQGFGAPINAWLRGPLVELLTDYLSPAQLGRSQLFDVAAVERLLKQHLEGSADFGSQLWLILQFEMWRERWA